jgi:hypothetical protein
MQRVGKNGFLPKDLQNDPKLQKVSQYPKNTSRDNPKKTPEPYYMIFSLEKMTKGSKN